MKLYLPTRSQLLACFMKAIICISGADAYGQAEVQNPATLPTGPGVFWKLTGNANTTDGTHFIGTTDMVPLNFRIGNVQAGRIDSAKGNVFWGYKAGVLYTLGHSGVGIGHQALSNNSSGLYNTAVGFQAAFANVNGADNTAIGYRALYSSSVPGLNTAIGSQSLFANSSGNNNTATGAYSLGSNTAGSTNSAHGGSALGNNTTGSRNTGMGYSALINNTTGNNNTALGYLTTLGSGTLFNATAIGALAQVNADNSMVLGSVAGINSATSNVKVGIGNNAPNTRLDITGDLAIRERTVALGSGTVSNLAIDSASFLRITSTGAVNITGFSTPYDGKMLTLFNASANNLALLPENTGSFAANRIITGAGTLTLADTGSATLQYSTAQSRWVLTSYTNGSFAGSTTTNDWSINGNAGTVDGTNFIGTTDMVPLNFRIGNVQAGRIDSANANVFMGYKAGVANTTGKKNVAIGQNTLAASTDRSSNIAIGDSALANNGTGASGGFEGQLNIAIGLASMASNTLGYWNTAMGSYSLTSSISGKYNSAFGQSALRHNTTGDGNTALGLQALDFNSIGSYNVGVGFSSRYNAQAGDLNVVVGSQAMYHDTAGSYNVAVGGYALRFPRHSIGNTAVGFESSNGVISNSSFTYNTSLGYRSLAGLSTGSFNVSVGANSLTTTTTGYSNTGIGIHALRTNITGYNNTALGDSANVGSSNLTNATAIGSKAQVNTSNSMVLGSVAGINTATTTTKVGIGNNAPNTRLDVKGDLALRERTITLANGQNNDVTTDTSSFLRIIGPTAAFSISGLANGFDGKLVTLINTTPYNLTIASQSIGSVAANRIMSAEGTIIVGDSGSISFQYSAALSRWMVTSHTNSTTEADGNTDYYSVVGTIPAVAPNNMGPMPQMNLTFTPLDTIAYVSFHATGSHPNGCGQYGLAFQLIVNGSANVFFNASLEDISNNSGKIWLAAIEIPITVVANTSNTVSVLWSIPGGCAQPIVNDPSLTGGIGLVPFGSYRTLIVKAPHGFGTVNALNQPALPSSDYWKLAGNAGTNPTSDYIGTSDNQSLKMKVNGNQAGWLGNNGTTYLGLLAGANATSSNELTAIGDSAMFSNTGGGLGLTAIGARTLVRNTTGDWNTALGNLALPVNTTGGWNTGLGYGALYRNISGNYNTAVGVDVLVNAVDQDYNTGIGTFALNQNTTGYNNTGIGANALYGNTVGHSNVAVGNLASTSAVAGEYNVSVGHRALTYNTDGGRNVAIGTFALRDQAFANAGVNYLTYNVALGYSALILNDPANVTASTSGKVNTAVGGFALNVNTTGYQNTGVGYGSNPSTGTFFNTTSLGYIATSSASNYVRVGNAAVTSIFGAVAFNTSDARFKTDVTETVPGLSFINGLRPVTYRFQKEKYSQHIGEMQEEPYVENLRAQDASGKRSSGFIAQEVESLATQLGYDFDGLYKPQNEKDTYGLGYAQFVVPLVKAVQEQQTIIENLKKRIEQLEKK